MLLSRWSSGEKKEGGGGEPDKTGEKKRGGRKKANLSPASRLRGLEWESSVIQSKPQRRAASSSAPQGWQRMGFAKGERNPAAPDQPAPASHGAGGGGQASGGRGQEDTTHTDLARSHGRPGGGNNAAEQRDGVREPSPVRPRREGKGRGGGGQPGGAGRSVLFRESRVSSQPF